MNKFILSSFLLFLFSCQEIKFKEPQPIDTPVLNSFPTELIGSYYDLKSNDTLILKPTSFTFGNKSSLTFVDAGLSDTVVLKMTNNVYYLNLFDKENKLWNLFVFRNDVVSNLHVSLFVIENNEQLEKIKAITPLEPVLNEEKEVDYYIAQPVNSELKRIVGQKLISNPIILKRVLKND